MPETLRLKDDLSSPAQARRWLRRWCVRWGCPDLVDDAALMVSELTTNAILHARTDCVIEAEFADQHLVVSVSDGMAGELRPPDRSRAYHGRGLAIVASMAEEWGVAQTDGGKMIWFTLVSKRL